MIQSITHSQCENKIIHNVSCPFPPKEKRTYILHPGPYLKNLTASQINPQAHFLPLSETQNKKGLTPSFIPHLR